MMESKPIDKAAAERRAEDLDTAPAERTAETGEPTPPKRKKVSWKSLLAVAVALVIVWQLFHVLHQGGGKKSASSSPASTAPATPTPTPTPTVTIGGKAVPASGGPSIVLDPGLVPAGGHVGIFGSGFTPHARVVVLLRMSPRSPGTVIAHTWAAKNGTVVSGFSMPATVTQSGATVVAEQAGGPAATAQLVTTGGVGTVEIVGKPAGKPGDTLQISASGFGPGEKVNVYWGRVSGTPAAVLTADSAGTIGRAAIRVGVAPVGETTLVLVGTRTHTTATTPYLMLGLYPTTASHPWAVRAGHPVTYTGSGFAPGEQVLIYLNRASGAPALTTTANNYGAFSVSFMVPFGLRGRQSLTAIGNQSRAATTSGFTVEPYLPSVEASTYGALPGTTLSFYATGFAANEVVLVYLGAGKGETGKLVTAFRVNAEGSAAAAGDYVVPSGVQGALYFTLVGQKSGGTGVAKVGVTAAPGGGQATVPSQPPYVLPPSLGGKPTAPAHPTPGKSPGGASHAPKPAP
jgi:hypothetical protein